MNAIPINERIYPHLPVLLQNAACWSYGRRERRTRFGRAFDSCLASLLNSEMRGETDIRAYQDDKVKEIITDAYHHVPYYRDLMTGLKLAPGDIRCVADLQKLPILTKETVRQNLERMVSGQANRRELIPRHTSGTSGKALHFYSGRDTIAVQWAVWWRHRMRFGLKVGDWHANFTGKLVVPPGQTRPPYWRWNKPMRQALLNMHHLTPSKIQAVVGFLNRQEFVFYSGYPSIIHMLALNAREAGLDLTSRPRVIVTGAEKVYEWQRAEIERFSKATLTDQYGFSEGCGNASQCPQFVYHEDFEFGVLECVDPQSAGHGRVRGKIVCTGFANPHFPFIRYDTGDIGTWESPKVQCACGRRSRVLVGIEGRTEDYVVTPEGGRIMRFDYIFKDTVNVREAQVVQERLGEIKLRIVRRPEYRIEDECFIANEIKRWVSPRLGVSFEYVSEIQRENGDKFKAVKSLVQPR